MSDNIDQQVSDVEGAATQEETPVQGDASVQDGTSVQDDATRKGADPEEPTSEESADEASQFTAEEKAQLEQSLQAALEEQDRLASMYRRLRADFDNYKRRTSEETERLKATATSDFILELLPVVDNLERAAQAAGEGEGPLAEGVRLVLRQLHQVLEGAGVEVIPSVGQPFDPNVHEAVGQVPCDDGTAEGTIVDEILKGYRMGERVLRPSMVRVAG